MFTLHCKQWHMIENPDIKQSFIQLRLLKNDKLYTFIKVLKISGVTCMVVWWISFVPIGVFSWVRIPFLDPLQLIFSCNLENNTIICSHCLDSYLRRFLIRWVVAAKLIWWEIMFWQTKVSGGNSSLHTQIIKCSAHFTKFHQNVVKN